jgi:two-component system LytT family response regulator
MNKSYSILIVDDLEIHIENLRNQLTTVFNEIDSIFEATNAKEAVEILLNEQIDLVFLDVEMPVKTGFELLKSIPSESLTFEVIFVTAYERYAIQAIRSSAIDFILKPVQQNELKAALDRFTEKRNNNLDIFNHKLIQLINSKEIPATSSKVGLPTLHGYLFVNEEDIVQCEADNTYTIFHLLNCKKIVVSKTLKECEQILNIKVFFRVHNSHIVNLNYIREYVRGEGGHVVLFNNQIVPVSRSKKMNFLSLIKKI